jgi:hypothetical protein
MQSVWFYTFEVIGSEKFLALYRHSHRRDEMPSGLGLEKTAAGARPSRLVNKRWKFMQCGQDYADFLVKFEDLSSSFQPVNFRHYEVHDNDVWMKADGQRHCGAATISFSANFPPRDSFQNVAQKNSHRSVIIRDKNS